MVNTTKIQEISSNLRSLEPNIHETHRSISHHERRLEHQYALPPSPSPSPLPSKTTLLTTLHHSRIRRRRLHLPPDIPRRPWSPIRRPPLPGPSPPLRPNAPLRPHLPVQIPQPRPRHPRRLLWRSRSIRSGGAVLRKTDDTECVWHAGAAFCCAEYRRRGGRRRGKG